MTIVSGLRIIDSNAQTGITWWNWTPLPLNSDDIFSIPTSTGVVNVTLPNHLLYPGVVTRDVVLIPTFCT
jgi:hypothetical protein